MSSHGSNIRHWYKVAGPDELPEGRVKTVTVEHGGKVLSFALSHFEGQYGAIDNACPHQGGPLGEGSIENGCLRCPWHGWDFHPITGKPPGGFDDGVDTFPVEARDDGVFIGLDGEPPRTRTVSDVMAETMVNWGITHVFGMVGHSNLGMADSLRLMEEQGRLLFIGVRHEGAAAFAASGYAKLTGDPAACLTIAGPGATNLMTGLWDAKVDRAPVLALTGQIKQQFFGPGFFQDLPLVEAFSAVARFNQMALPASNHAELMGLALRTAKIERDVSNIVLPDDVQPMEVGEDASAGSPDGRMASVAIAPPADAIEKAMSLLKASKRPVIVVGHGARFSMPPIIALAEQLRCPVLTTFKGKGLIGDDHPCGAGVLGRSGTPVASWFMNESDLLLVFGASFSSHTGITPKKPTIQVDFDRMALSRFHGIDAPLWGETEVTCRLLAAQLSGHETTDQRAEVADRWRIWRAEKASRLHDDESMGVSSSSVFASMNRVIPRDAIIAVDVGNNTYSFGRYFEASGSQSVLMSGYLGSIGFGYPAAMGAWAATQVKDRWDERFLHRPVVCVSGDGGFGQYAWEVNTAVKYAMNITHVLLNNNELGKISKEQRSGEWPVWQTSLSNPNIADYVNNCGGLGIRVTNTSELDDAIERALAYPGPATVEVMTDVSLI